MISFILSVPVHYIYKYNYDIFLQILRIYA